MPRQHPTYSTNTEALLAAAYRRRVWEHWRLSWQYRHGIPLRFRTDGWRRVDKKRPGGDADTPGPANGKEPSDDNSNDNRH